MATLCTVLAPMMPPPHRRLSSLKRSLKLTRIDSLSLLKAAWSSLRISVKASAVAVFLFTTWPRRALDLTMQYGTPILRQRAGRKMTTSMGSTSWAITTSCAFFSSISHVMWLIPYLTVMGLGPLLTSCLAATALASSARRLRFWRRVSGVYLSRRRNSSVAVPLSAVLANCAMAGGTLSRFMSTAFCRCSRTYFGHLTKRPRSRFPGISPPMPKVRFFGWKRLAPCGSSFI
mmetsp:Transcript_16059/g.41632  ORF Transcript_16059/g.41632 Transcript_16059/m.41632 type:complete len:232 (-) Transcript_16059:44-739(-)